MTEKLKYILYARKSSEAKERQVASIGDQKAECKKCALDNGLEIVKELEESGSAYKPHNRPLFDTMLKMIKRGEADAILTWKPDRLCRNPEEGGKLLQMLQDGVIREIRSPLGEVYTPDSDQLILQIHFGMATQYSKVISQNVRRAMKHKVNRGEYFRSAPIGYLNYGEVRGTKTIKPDPLKALVIKKAYEMYATGFHSLRSIAQFLFDNGITSGKGKMLGNSNIRKILSNPVYYGYFYYKGELFKGTYEPIVSKALFDLVQSKAGDRTKNRVNSWNQEYNGLIKCGECGGSITTTVKKKFYKGTNRTVLYHYHHCTKKKGVCSQAPITTDKLEDLLNKKFEQLSIDNEVWRLGLDLVKARHDFEVKQNNTQLDHFRNQYDRIQTRINNLVKLRTDNELTAEEFKEQKNNLLQDRARIEELLNDTKYSADNWIELVETFLNDVFHIKEVMEMGEKEEKRNMIIKLCSNLLLKDGNLDITWRKPYDILLNPAYRTNWQGR